LIASINVPDEYVKDVNAELVTIKSALGLVHTTMNANDIGREAFAVYKWVVEQMANGKTVVATDETLQVFHQMSTPNLPASSKFNP
jgi:hypothetical protein